MFATVTGYESTTAIATEKRKRHADTAVTATATIRAMTAKAAASDNGAIGGSRSGVTNKRRTDSNDGSNDENSLTRMALGRRRRVAGGALRNNTARRLVNRMRIVVSGRIYKHIIRLVGVYISDHSLA